MNRLIRKNIILCIAFTVILFLIYSYRLTDSFLLTSDFGRDIYQSIRISQGEFVLIGSKMNLGGYSVGPYLYYIFAIFLLIGRFDITALLYLHTLLFAITGGFFFWALSRKFNILKTVLAAASIALTPLYILCARYPSNGYTYLSFLLIIFAFAFLFRINKKLIIFLGFSAGILFNIHPTSIFATGFIFLYIIFFLANRGLLLYFGGSFLITFFPVLIFELRHNFVMFRDTFINHSYLTFTEGKNTPQLWLNRNPTISTFLFLSDKFRDLIIMQPVFYFGGILAVVLNEWKRKKEVHLDLFLGIGAFISFIILLGIMRFHFELHYIFSTLFFAVFAAIYILLRSKFWFLLIIIILLEINSFVNQPYGKTVRSYTGIENAVRFTVDKNLVKKGESFNLIGLTDAYGLVPTGFEYRFFFRKYGFYPNSEYDYQNAQKLLIFSETPYYDIDRFKMWSTEQFGREYFAKRNTYQVGGITIYSISKN